MKKPRLRDGGSGKSRGPWAIGSIPESVLLAISRQLVHRLVVGYGDIAGDNFGTIFANAINGEHRQSSVGIIDVVWNGCAWSVKTVKEQDPIKMIGRRVRLISGRNSPDYSLDISNPRADPEATGEAVLSIWNERINLARSDSDDIRMAVLCRNMQTQKYLLFEEPCIPFPADEYRWTFNKRKNLEGHRKTDNAHCFTWQPHGSQFSIFRTVPGSACRFGIERAVPAIEMNQILDLAQYSDQWVKFY